MYPTRGGGAFQKKEGKKRGWVAGWLGGAVCVLPKRERVECFGLGHSLNPPPPFSSIPNQFYETKCPNIPHNFARESLVGGRCYVVMVFQWRIIWPLPCLSIYGSNEAGKHLWAGRRCPSAPPTPRFFLILKELIKEQAGEGCHWTKDKHCSHFTG